MSPDLDKALCEKYPKIFRDRHAPMSVTCMCWGFDHGDGWYEIIDNLCGAIQNYIDHVTRYVDGKPQSPPQVIAVQVKEKYGTLRFYFDGGDEEIHGMVTMAEYMSAHTCETCGAEGHMTNHGWYRTLCDIHDVKKV
jgi:hypothetical protein